MKKLLFLSTILIFASSSALETQSSLQYRNYEGPLTIAVLNNNKVEYWAGSAYVDDRVGHVVQFMEKIGTKIPTNNWPLIANDDEFTVIYHLLYGKSKQNKPAKNTPSCELYI